MQKSTLLKWKDNRDSCSAFYLQGTHQKIYESIIEVGKIESVPSYLFLVIL